MSFEGELKSQAHDYLQWIGGNGYSVESFVKEAKKMGVSRRINCSNKNMSFFPKNIVRGVSKVFLISDMPTEEARRKYREEYNRRLREAYVSKDRQVGGSKKYNSIRKPEPMPRGEPVIFGYFTINSVVYITGPGVNVPEELTKLGVEAYEYQEGSFGFNDERGCGSLKIGGTYFLSEEGMEEIKNMASQIDVESKNIHILKVPVPAKDIKRFRGIKEIPIQKLMELEATTGDDENAEKTYNPTKEEHDNSVKCLDEVEKK